MARVGLIQRGRNLTGVLSCGTGITNVVQEQEPKVCLELELRDLPPAARWLQGSSLGHELQTPPPARMLWQTYPQAQEWSALLWGGTFKQVGEDEAGAAAVASGEAVTVETGNTADRTRQGSGARRSCCKSSKGTLISGAWATPRRSPGSRYKTPTRGKTCRSVATKGSSTEGGRYDKRATCFFLAVHLRSSVPHLKHNYGGN